MIGFESCISSQPPQCFVWCQGIYSITNQATGDRYVGKSKDIVGRWERHRSRLRLGKHENLKLQQNWNLYGEDSFSLEVLEAVMPHPGGLDSGLGNKEAYWCHILNPSLNLNKVLFHEWRANTEQEKVFVQQMISQGGRDTDWRRNQKGRTKKAIAS